jgi:enoyl-CoA hydratase/carnithine racemase
MTQETSEQQGPVVKVDTYEGGKIHVLTLNRPHRMNAIGGGLMDALVDAFEAFRDDPQARVAILTGAGRAFCAGQDLKESAERMAAIERGEASGPLIPQSGRSVAPLAEGLGVWKPTIAAINGFAVAGGFMLAMQCDIRIAAESARIGIAEARWNRKGGGWMAPVTRQIGLGNALQLILWGDTQWTAQRAYDAGWVQEVVPDDQLMPRAMEYAARAIDMAPRSVRNLKQALYRGYYMTPPVAQSFGVALEQNLEGMQDTIEGARAFAEKRRPNYLDA